jgi:ketosteroid isomerase-like protein
MSNNVTEGRLAMLHRLFDAIDAKDTDGLLSFLAPDATQTFANQDPLHGHDEIRSANDEFFAMIPSIKHDVIGAWEWDGTIIVHLWATYGRPDGRSVTVPAVTMLTESDGLITDYQVYVDQGPVFAPSASSVEPADLSH